MSTYLDFQTGDSEEVSEYGAEAEELSRQLDPWRLEPELAGFERYFVDPSETPPVTVRPVTLYHCTVVDCAVMRGPYQAGRDTADADRRDASGIKRPLPIATSSASQSPGRTKGGVLDEGKNKSDVVEEGSTKRDSMKTTEGKNRLVDKRTVDSTPSSTSSQPMMGSS